MRQRGWVRVLVLTAMALVAAAVVAGLVVAGSPADARLERLDKKRLSDLRRIADGIDVYWARHSVLPGDLQSLDGELRLGLELMDPQDGAPYVYRTVDSDIYEICARFARDCRDKDGACAGWHGPHDSRLLTHGAGEDCFQLAPKKPSK